MKKNVMIVSFVFIFLILLSIGVYSVKSENHLILLAVAEKEDGNLSGSSADLSLEIIQGKGRVFINSFPYSKLDTQISTRFAKEIACDFIQRNKQELIDVDCSNYDFIYTIQAGSPIIGGPSGGTAISILTISSLLDIELEKNVAITGTINSGGFIGVVSGIKFKIDAAHEAGLKKVLIPYRTRYYKEEDIDLKEYAKEKGIELFEVGDLSDAIYHFTGKKLIEYERNLEIDKEYVEIMKKLSDNLCKRSNDFIDNIDEINEEDIEFLKKIEGKLIKSEEAYENKKYYTSASYCFGSNIELNNFYLEKKGLSYEEAVEYSKNVEDKIFELEKEIDSKKIKTNSDLQTYMVVKERIIETKELLNEFNQNKEDYIHNLAFAEERYYSAVSWKEFFDSNIGEEKLFEDKKIIKRLCNEKIEEAKERTYYLALTFPIGLETIEKEINYSENYRYNEEYELCLFKALKAKAQANSILNALNIREEYLNDSLRIKLNIIKNNIIMENDNNIFPIMGYSYYEYSDELKYTDLASSLLYAEYALELSNFHVYLDKKNGEFIPISNVCKKRPYELYIVLILFGVLIGLLYNFKISQKRPKKRE